MINHEKSISVKPPRPFWRRRETWVIVGICLFLVWWSRRVPLPSDEEMIAHFQAHRAEFEELVRRYRTFAEREHWPELAHPDDEVGTKKLQQLAGVRGVNYLLLLDWLPEPYSLATAQRVQAMDDSCTQDWKRWHLGGNSCFEVSREGKIQDEKRRLAMDCQKVHLPPPKCRLFRYQYGVLNFDPESRNSRRFSLKTFSLRLGTVWKTYLHFPEPPRIEAGYLLGPMRTDGKYSYKDRAFSSLNYYPFNLKMDECVYRPIDSHWFLRLCNH